MDSAGVYTSTRVIAGWCKGQKIKKQQMKNKILIAGVSLAGAAVMLGGVALVSAHGIGGFGFGAPNISPTEWASNQATAFQNEASALGLSPDTIKNGWAAGKSLREIATENGISESDLQTKMHAVRQAEMKARLQALVANGTITQAQMDQRLQFMETQQSRIQSMIKDGNAREFGRGHKKMATPTTTN